MPEKEKHTTYGIGPISEERMRDIMDDLWRSVPLGVGRRALRDELTIGQFANPVTDSDMHTIYPVEENALVFSEYVLGYFAKANLETYDPEDPEFVWQNDGFTYPSGIDYDEVNDLLAVGHNGGVSILNQSTGAIVQNIVDVAGEVLGRIGGGVRFNPSNTDELYIGTQVSSRVFRYNWRTDTVLWSYGAIGDAPATELSTVLDVEPAPAFNRLYVVDHYNWRIKVLNSTTGAADHIIPLIHPISVYHGRWGARYVPYSLNFGSGVGTIGIGGFPVVPRFIYPIRMDSIRFTPSLQYMWTTDASGFKFNYTQLVKTQNPYFGMFYSSRRVVVAAAQYFPTFSDEAFISSYMFPNRTISIGVTSDQTGTLTIEVPDDWTPAHLAPIALPVAYNMVTYDAQATRAQHERYIMTSPPPLFKVLYTPDAPANVIVDFTVL